MAYMDKFSRRSAVFVFWFIIIVSLHIPSTIGTDENENEIKAAESSTSVGKTMQDTVNMLYDAISVLQNSHQDAWDKVKGIISDMQLQISTPNLDFRGGGDLADANNRDGMGEKVKDAAQRSFETGKHTVEETAKLAAETVGETVHKTAEKVKETVSHEDL